MFTALCMSDEGKTKSGFSTTEEAEEYIERFLCDVCQEDFKKGFIEFDGDKNVITSVLETDCGASWFIIKDEEYETAESMEDIFIAAGCVPDSEHTWDALTIDQKCRISNKQAELDKENKNGSSG